ncbi:N-acetyltransferase [Methylobacterium sp. NEAU K]|uniref:GNAT family N-acetyltransferase n=1 Tax=Methylobacterium sp. NEAU K TaxID=3064946 RepID=UPI002732D440|nr:GNAT family N-acetyltransferase [Methylobacterium sp. NEAU K]MDP4003993.1 GNAT family N-acetyltransferase [Methylobacterium sp. NEAU K]
MSLGVDSPALRHAEANVGLLELDVRQPGTGELADFGLTSGAIGQGIGRALVNAAIGRPWSRPIERLWLHTCTLDHPAALDFYRRSRFEP